MSPEQRHKADSLCRHPIYRQSLDEDSREPGNGTAVELWLPVSLDPLGHSDLTRFCPVAIVSTDGSFWCKQTSPSPMPNERFWVDSGLTRTAARLYADDHPPQQAHSHAGHNGSRRVTMNTEETIQTPANRQAWNAGRMVGAKRAVKPKQIWEIRFSNKAMNALAAVQTSSWFPLRQAGSKWMSNCVCRTFAAVRQTDSLWQRGTVKF